jgi:putative membrane protein
MNGKQLVAMVCGSMLFGAAPAFAQTGEAGQPAAGEPAPAAAPPAEGAAAVAATDPQIAAIVVAANQADIDAAKVAKSGTKNKDVKEFAETMIRDHEAVNKEAKALVKKLKVKPEASPTSKSLEGDGKQNIKALKKLKGAELDKAYLEHEVAYHQEVLDTIKSTLLPNAKNPELKALIEKVTPAYQAHLEHAKKLQSELASGGEAK